MIPIESAEFRRRWHSGRPTAFDPAVEQQVREIVQEVRNRGDAALLDLTARWDGVRLLPPQLEVTAGEWDEGAAVVDAPTRQALDHAAERIEDFYRAQAAGDIRLTPRQGSLLGEVTRPLKRVGLYVPGGRALYPSSVLMSALPARVAGVQEVVLTTPPDRQGAVSPVVLAAARRAGVHRVFRVGGAQAVAALAYGTETVPRVDLIAGPGNVYVTLAKKIVAGEVALDGLAGPSEIVILADATLPPAWAAADLLAQAEHDPDTASILISTDAEYARAVAAELERQLPLTPRTDIASRALDSRGALVVARDREEAVELANLVAPEHLQVSWENPWSTLAGVENAGAIFLGPHSPVAAGDYAAGPSHVLPTGGTARFASGLTLETFRKRSSLIALDARDLEQIKDTASHLARLEGLYAHSQALEYREGPQEDDAN